MMVRIRLLLILLTMLSLINIACGPGEKGSAPDLQGIGDRKLFTFISDGEHYLASARPFPLSPETSLKSALDKLGTHLADTFFHKTYLNEETNIRFETVSIHDILVEPRGLRIGVVNMIDEEEFAMSYFFQGSTGAQTTFYMLSATFTQPHLAVPLVDGLILLYNGKVLPEMDHINLSGILTPGTLRNAAVRAIQNTRTEQANVPAVSQQDITTESTA
ncbi:MAG: hypothetical protein JW882_10650 [Deltaproteobacteria bacterium]|nr:hypothetical protein [Deltaproteobacteria bacterium]